MQIDTEKASNDIIAGDGRERYMIALKFIEFFYGTALLLASCIFQLHNWANSNSGLFINFRLCDCDTYLKNTENIKT